MTRIPGRGRRFTIFAVLGAASCAVFLVPLAGAGTVWPQFDFDPQHTGNNTQETSIDRTRVSALAMKFQVTLPGIADGAPAYLPNVATAAGARNLLFLTTKAGHILAVD